MTEVALVRPSLQELPGYVAALRTGWSPDNVRREQTAREHLQAIASDATGFLASLDDIEARGPPIPLPDGSTAPRLPSFARWIWDGSFCGQIGFRWQPGTSVLPPSVLGHIGYAVVPWKRGAGRATRALALMLPIVRAHGLDWIELNADADNIASQRVITACGGTLLGRFKQPASHGDGDLVRFRIDLD